MALVRSPHPHRSSAGPGAGAPRPSPEARAPGELLDDTSVAAGFSAGDEGSLEVAYRRWGSLVFTLARRTLGDEREAEDVTQQVFLAAWRGRRGYRPGRGGLAGWLVGITRHKVADALAARSRRAELVAAAAAFLSPAPGPATGPGPEQAVDRVLVLRALQDLPSAQQHVIRLAFYADLTQTQIADRTGLPLGTVKSHMRRALLSLRRSLTAEE
ncbi:RNA polymerase sigma factor [Streptomyces sp. I6]|uniref:RNA polymerase sigma factor n=1 Tax=Streptomyces sp. I6 TaxID=2483113 RepID=UPI000F44912B|nr:sigma-70 family RNA polymerase sigma factor [Streptomyces sp. I6]RNL73282.1 sigma-70 family RNA polymerase sigma factor [Streptomyces sp. I6]